MKYTEEKLKEAVANSYSVIQVMTYLGCKVTGGGHSHISGRIKKYGIDTSHFTGQLTNSGPNHKGGPKKKAANEVLVKANADNREKTHVLKRAMIEVGKTYECESCNNNGIWNGQSLTLHIDHIDGDWNNNEIDNLRFLCPNCHSQTKTFGAKNIHAGVVKRDTQHA